MCKWEIDTDHQRVSAAIVAYQRLLTHYTAGVTGNLEIAREIVQEAFLRLWKSEGEKIAPSGEKPWLLRVCRNLAIDFRRREGKVIPTEDIDNVAFHGPVDAGARDEELCELQTLLATLKPKEQEVVRLRFQHDLSYKEIAAVTDLSVSHVGVILHEALKKLKEHFSQPAGEAI